MKALSAVTAILLAALAGAAPRAIRTRDDIEDAARVSVANLTATALQNVLAALDAREDSLRRQGKPAPSCTSKNLVLRRE